MLFKDFKSNTNVKNIITSQDDFDQLNNETIPVKTKRKIFR